MTTVTATDKALLVQYKEDGKLYNTANVEGGGSADPFDQVIVQPGASFDVPGTLLRVRELGDAPAQGGTPDDDAASANAPDAVPSGNAPQQGGTPD